MIIELELEVEVEKEVDKEVETEVVVGTDRLIEEGEEEEDGIIVEETVGEIEEELFLIIKSDNNSFDEIMDLISKPYLGLADTEIKQSGKIIKKSALSEYKTLFENSLFSFLNFFVLRTSSKFSFFSFFSFFREIIFFDFFISGSKRSNKILILNFFCEFLFTVSKIRKSLCFCIPHLITSISPNKIIPEAEAELFLFLLFVIFNSLFIELFSVFIL